MFDLSTNQDFLLGGFSGEFLGINDNQLWVHIAVEEAGRLRNLSWPGMDASPSRVGIFFSIPKTKGGLYSFKGYGGILSITRPYPTSTRNIEGAMYIYNGTYQTHCVNGIWHEFSNGYFIGR